MVCRHDFSSSIGDKDRKSYFQVGACTKCHVPVYDLLYNAEKHLSEAVKMIEFYADDKKWAWIVNGKAKEFLKKLK